jgi:hypothetical protein
MARHELRGEIVTTAAARVELRQARKWPPKIGRPAQDNGASGREAARDREQDSYSSGRDKGPSATTENHH